ncbi:MAG: AAA family ATPase [Saprospiraceae bacterium]
MKKGFVFGKYLPFHKGHQALVTFALGRCDYLYVVVCGSDKETLAVETRVNWIRTTFAGEKRLEVVELFYLEANLPNTSVSSMEVSRLWASKFKNILPEVEVLITSEPYGDMVAQFMQIEHVLFDQERMAFPISATKIRASIHDNWHFLPDIVKTYYQKKIVFLGTESTGKSSLSKAIATAVGGSWVEEVGRKIIADSNDFTQAQLIEVARSHATNIQLACQELKPWVLIDTDIHITQSYAKYQFGHYLEIEQSIYDSNQADLYLFLTNALHYEQDGTRLSEAKRNELDHFHKATLADFGIPYREITGTWAQRYQAISLLLDHYFDEMFLF